LLAILQGIVKASPAHVPTALEPLSMK